MLVKDWLSDFIRAHQGRHPRDDWPVEGSGSGESRALWCQWLEAFIRDGVTREEAEGASIVILGGEIPRYEMHLDVLLHTIAEARRLAAAAGHAGFILGATVEQRKAQCEALLDELYGQGFRFEWDRAVNLFRCIPVDGPYRRPSDEQCARIRALNRGLWTLLAPLRDPDPGIPPGIAGLDWRAMVAALARRGELRRVAMPIAEGSVY